MPELPPPPETPPAAPPGRTGCSGRVALVLVAMLMLAGAFGFAMILGTRRLVERFVGADATRITQSVVVERTRAVARLVTSETALRDVVTFENRRLGSTKRAIVIATGRVLAGVDLEEDPRVAIDHDARRITIDLPRARVLSVEVTDLTTFDEQRGLWNPFRPSDRDSIFQLARRQLESTAEQVQVSAHAEMSAARILEDLFSADGYTVVVRFDGRAASPVPASLAPLQ